MRSTSITAPPASLLVGTGAAASFTVSAGGGGVLTYKWLKNNVAIAGATSATYSIAAVGGVGQTMREKQHPHGVDGSPGDDAAGSSRL